MNNLSFNDKIVVITGGATGIGLSCVELFLEAGAKVVFSGRRADKGKEVLDRLNNPGLRFFQCDVSKESDVIDLREFTIAEFGSCSVLVNNAGIFKGGCIHETPVSDWDELFRVNATGVYFCSREFLPDMLKAQKGAIVNTCSVSGILGEYNMAAYCATKGAVANLTRCMALDYADKGIRVNSVCPGATETPMFLTGSTPDVVQAFNEVFPPRRVGKPGEVARAVLFLASDAASFVNGVNLPVEGGISAHSGQPRQMKED